MNDSAFSNVTVLAVEDNDFALKVLGKHLEGIGVGTVVTSRNGQEALDAVNDAANRIDVIVCDLEMQEIDGHTFVQNFPELPEENKRTLPVIILTGHSDPSNIERAAKSGVEAYFVKPVERKILKQRLQEVLKIG